MGLGKDYTLYALRPGVVVFHMTKHKRDVSFAPRPDASDHRPACMLPLWDFCISQSRITAVSD